jgi:formamidopyrimidine-DNA glycosylase
MPELPEVEVTRIGIEPYLIGEFVQHIRIGKPLRWPLGCDVRMLLGKHILSVTRRGKYVLLQFDLGLLLIHLGMSGSLRFYEQAPLAGLHDHFDLITQNGTLRLNDPRRFGAVVYAKNIDDPIYQKLLGGLGVEPLSNDFVARNFHIQLKRRTAAIKQVLLAGNVVVGVGNIYASEALFLAKILPLTRACDVQLFRIIKLHRAIIQVLTMAIEKGGSSLKNFVNVEGQSGHFQLSCTVYGRAGLPCLICQTPILQCKQGARSTFYCPHCQRN